MIRLLPALLIFFLSLPAAAQVFHPQSFTLDNGLQVIVVPNDRAPVVSHMVWYKVGAADEPPSLSGMAHYFEHLMFKGTEKLAPGEFSKTVSKLGGDDNAFTGQDYTAYYQNIATDHLETVMAMEADRMMNLAVPEDHFASEKQVVIEERRQRTENEPKALFAEQMRSALFVNHPYGTPVIGWMNEIQDHDWEELKKFYAQWYAPNNVVVVISGDVTADEVRPLAEKTYGRLEPRDLPSRQRTEVPPAIGVTQMELRHESINQPAFQSLRLAPTEAKNKDDALSLQVLEEILSGGPTTRLYKALVVDQKKAISVGMGYDAAALDYGTISLYGVPADGVTPLEIRDAIHAEIQKVIENGVTETEVAESVQRLQDSAVFARDSLSAPARIIGAAVMTGSTLQDIESWPQDIAAVTPARVQEAAATYLNEDNPWIRPAVEGYLYPASAVEEAPAVPDAEEGEQAMPEAAE
jgi:zinc protease